MAFGTFTLTGHFDAYGGAPASGKVRIDGIPQVIVDTGGDKIKVGPKTVVLDSAGNFSIALPSDATTGNSTSIGFRVTADLKGLATYGPVEFYARPISQTVDLADITPQIIEPIGDTAANVIASEAAADRAEAAALAAATAGVGIDPGAEAFLAKVDMRSSNAVIALLGDSTGNAPSEWFRLAFGSFLADRPKLRGEYYGWDDNTVEPWSDTSSGAYNAVEVVQTGTAGVVEQNAVHDTFTRTAADLFGSTPEIGAAWTGAANAAGDWALSGGKAVASADTTRFAITADGGVVGDQRVVATGVTLSTASGASNRSFILHAKNVSTTTNLQAELRTAAATGVTTLWLQKRVANTTTALTSIASGLATNQATVNLSSFEIRVQGALVTVLINGVSMLTYTLADADVATFSTAQAAGFSSVNQAGMTIDGFDLYATNNIPAATVKAYNGSLGGTTWSGYQNPRMARILPEAPDVVFLSSSHNYGAMNTTDYLAEVKTTVDKVRSLWPDAGIVLVAQNPRYSPAAFRTEHGNRMAALRKYAKTRGYGYLPAYERFLASAADEGRSKILPDGIHPTTGAGDTGSGFWASVANELLRPPGAVVAGTADDALIAASVSSATSATNTELGKKYARKSFVDVREFAAGSTVDATAMQAAADAHVPLLIPNGVTVDFEAPYLSIDSGFTLRIDRGGMLRKTGSPNTGGTVGAMIRNRDFATKVNDVSIFGDGEIRSADLTKTGRMISLYGDRIRLRPVITQWAGGMALVVDGDDILIWDPQISGDAGATGSGGIRVTGGNRFKCIGGRVICGDDALQFVPSGNPSDPLFDHSIRGGRYIGVTGVSMAAKTMSVAIQNSAGDATLNMTCSVTDVGFTDCDCIPGVNAVLIHNLNSTGSVDGVYVTRGSSDAALSSAALIGGEIFVNSKDGTGGVRNVYIDGHRVRNPRGSTVKTNGMPERVSLINMDSVRSDVAPTASVYALSGYDSQIRGGTIDGKNTAADVMEMTSQGAGDPGPTRPVVEGTIIKRIAAGQYGVRFAQAARPTVRRVRFEEAASGGRAWNLTATSSDPTVIDNDLTALTGTIKYNDVSTGTRTYRNNPPLAESSGVGAASGVRKATDTVRNNVGAIADDPELTVAVAPGTYMLFAHIEYQSSTTADITTGWTLPAGSTLNWSMNGLGVGSTSAIATMNKGAGGGGNVINIGGTGSRASAEPAGTLIVTTAGNVTFRWAQLVAEATDTTVYAGSSLTLLRIA